MEFVFQSFFRNVLNETICTTVGSTVWIPIRYGMYSILKIVINRDVCQYQSNINNILKISQNQMSLHVWYNVSTLIFPNLLGTTDRPRKNFDQSRLITWEILLFACLASKLRLTKMSIQLFNVIWWVHEKRGTICNDSQIIIGYRKHLPFLLTFSPICWK